MGFYQATSDRKAPPCKCYLLCSAIGFEVKLSKALRLSARQVLLPILSSLFLQFSLFSADVLQVLKAVDRASQLYISVLLNEAAVYRLILFRNLEYGASGYSDDQFYSELHKHGSSRRKSIQSFQLK